MKISCEACGAKYSIADDKVGDRTLKVRCKKCSNVIIVRAVSAAPVATVVEPEPPAMAAGPDADPDAIWHVVIDQQQVGPMTTEDIAARVAVGEVGPDTYVWREGLDDWQPLAVSELAGLSPSSASTAPEPGPAADDPWLPPEPAAPAANRLRGERNESSVLFTLGNLAQLAQPAGARASGATASATATATGSSTTGAPINEGSGLIDIRSMASAYRGDRPGKPATATASSGSMDDLPTFTTSAFAEPAVLMPSPRATARGPLIPMLLAAVAVLAIALTVLVVVVVRDHGSTAAAATPATTPTHDTARGGTEVASTEPRTPPNPTTGPATAPVTGPANASTPGPSAPPATTIPTPPGPAPAPPAPPPPAPPGHGAKPPNNPRPHTPAPVHTPDDPVTSPPKPPSEKCDQVTCMMADNKPDCCAPFRTTAGTHKPTTDSNLPEELDLAAVRNAMALVKPKAAACGAKSSAKGDVKVGVKVGPDGSVKSTTVKQSPDAALGDCVAAAVKKVTFPKTQKGGSFTYPQRF